MANNSVWQFPCSLNFCNFRWCPIKSPFPSASDQLDLSRSRSANPCASCSRHGCLTFKMRVWGCSGRSFGSQSNNALWSGFFGSRKSLSGALGSAFGGDRLPQAVLWKAAVARDLPPLPVLVQRRQNPTTVVRAWVPAVPAVLVAPPGLVSLLVTLGRSLLGSSGRFFK